MNTIDIENANTMRRLRISLGYSCFFLPILSVFFAVIGELYGINSDECWYSISATYFTTASIIMSSLLFNTSRYFFAYKGYTIGDRILSIICAISAAFIVIFPCSCKDWDIKRLILPFISRELSNTIHCVSAGILFSTFAVMIGFQFTKTNNDEKNPFKYFITNLKLTWSNSSIMGEKKKLRNKIYFICALVIFVFMLLQVVTSVLEIKWMTVVNEAFMLWAFAIAWLIKGGKFINLND